MAEMIAVQGMYFGARESLEDAKRFVKTRGGKDPYSLIAVTSSEFGVDPAGNAYKREGQTLWLAVRRQDLADMLRTFDDNVRKQERGELPSILSAEAAESATEALAEIVQQGGFGRPRSTH